MLTKIVLEISIEHGSEQYLMLKIAEIKRELLDKIGVVGVKQNRE